MAFDGSRYTLYASNLLLRTALRIIVPIAESRVQNERHLYNDVYNIEWESYFNVDQTFAIYSTVSSDIFTHSKFVALKAKDAIVDRFRKLKGSRPNIDTNNPDFMINIHIRKNILTVSLDSTGDSLHKRGYRLATVPAPLNEVMAAGLLLLSGWDKTTTLVDSMCGSGTILSEAYLMSRGIPPQKINRPFAFKSWKDFNPDIWKMVIEKEIPKLPYSEPELFGFDNNRKAVDAAGMNMSELCEEDEVKISYGDFFKISSKDFNTKGLIIVNPPYDKRLREDDIKSYYKKIGDHLKGNFPGWTAFIFSGATEALKLMGLKPSRKISLLNGAIPSLFYKFDMYAGSKYQK